jgi:hypothetical protein
MISLAVLVTALDATADRPDHAGGSKGNSYGKDKKNGRQGTASEPAENSPPVINGTPDTSILEGNFYDFLPDASDPDGDTLRFQISNQPAWTDFDPTTGALYGTPAAADLGHYRDIQISLSDGQQQSLLNPFSVDVSAMASGSVTLTWTPPTENTDGTALTDLSGYRIYFSDDPAALDNVIQVSNPGLTAYVIEDLERTDWHFAMTALNSQGIESDPTAIVTRDVR